MDSEILVTLLVGIFLSLQIPVSIARYHFDEHLDNLNETSQAKDSVRHYWVSFLEAAMETSPEHEAILESLKAVTVSPQKPNKENSVTIIVMGRRESGITSTIEELIGHKTNCSTGKNTTLSDVTEYTISDIPIDDEYESNYKLQLVDVPGFVDGRLLEEDAQILATLKSYLTIKEPSGPIFFIVVSRFDEKMDYKTEYQFIQLLKRVELFRDIFLEHVMPSKASFLFLLTRLMAESPLNQRQPETKISKFQQVLMDYTSANFSSVVSFVVGDNNVIERKIPEKDGFYVLPNEELYPKNVWQALLKNTNDDVGRKVLTSMIENRKVEMTCETEVIDTEWEHYDDDAKAFKYLLMLENPIIEDTGINQDIEKVIGRSDNPRSKYMEALVQKSALQLFLQRDKIRERKDLPKNETEKLNFFQKSPLVSQPITADILSVTFELNMTKHTDAWTVGYGYPVLDDNATTFTPFENTFLPSSTGYQIPSYMKCTKLQKHEVVYFMNFARNTSAYFSSRLGLLQFPEKAYVDIYHFSGKIKLGFNVDWVDSFNGSDVGTLTALMEVRTLLCTLRKSKFLRLNKGFVEEVIDLKRFNSSDRESVAEWKNFFNRYGSHIVSRGFAGGKLLGRIEGPEVVKVFNSSKDVDNTLNSIMNFSSFSDPSLGAPKYKFYGGDILNESVANNLYKMSVSIRYDLLKNWQKSLSSNFVMLENELVLEPISSIIKNKIGEEKGTWVEEAISLYLRGEIRYKRIRRPKTKLPSRRTHNSTQNTPHASYFLSKQPSENEDEGAFRLNPNSQRHENDGERYRTLLAELRERNRRDEEAYQQLQRDKERRRMEEERIREQRKNQCSWFGSCAWKMFKSQLI